MEKADFFDKAASAPWSDHAYLPEERERIHRVLCLAGIERGGRVLEPGCGTGRLTELLARRVGPEGRVVATEISGTMLRRARTRLGKTHQVEFHFGPVERLPLAEASFDHVLCHQVLPHFEDRAATIRILSRCLCRGGRFIVSHLRPSAWINDVHRKAGSVVAKDQLPSLFQLRPIIADNSLVIETFQDKVATGYLLIARKKETG
jgi:demethylmenaquinone methyltransferase/2-methoxy-6-polyprenyl-1,4-benzoquinol methylase